MYHSVTINGKNTWNDYHMIPANGIYLPPPPEQKRTTIDLKTGNGLLDISTVLTGYPLFQNRSDELQYLILDPWDLAEMGITTTLAMPNAYDVYSQLLSDIHGKQGTMIFEDDPDWYYQGIFTVRSMETNSIRRAVSIGYEVSPYKIKNTSITGSSTTINSSEWTTFGYSASEIGNMPVHPKVQVTSMPSNSSLTIEFSSPAGQTPVITKTVTAAQTYTWPDVIVYNNSLRIRYKGSADSGYSVTHTITPGRL